MAILDRFRLDGKVAIVTGGAGYIGTSISTGLAEAGATSIIASRNVEGCEALAAKLESDGLSAVGLTLDLADDDSIQALPDKVMERFGRIDILVNNSTSKSPGDMASMTVEQWERAMRVDATGFFRLTQLCLQQMLEQGGGNIVNIASIYGMIAPDQRLYPPKHLANLRPHYYFNKAGMINLTNYLAVAYADRNIRANCVSPGGISTDQSEEIHRLFGDRTPMGRLGVPDEIAGAVIYLASEASSYVTGHNLVVDGGFTAW